MEDQDLIEDDLKLNVPIVALVLISLLSVVFLFFYFRGPYP